MVNILVTIMLIYSQKTIKVKLNLMYFNNYFRIEISYFKYYNRNN